MTGPALIPASSSARSLRSLINIGGRGAGRGANLGSMWDSAKGSQSKQAVRETQREREKEKEGEIEIGTETEVRRRETELEL